MTGPRSGDRDEEREWPKTRRRSAGSPTCAVTFGPIETPVYFVSPIAFNLLGIDRWVRQFYYVNYFDSFDGGHPCVFVPPKTPHAQFGSIEDVCNYLLAHDAVNEFVVAHRQRGANRRRGKAVFVFFDEESERRATEVGLDVALPAAELRHRLDSKIITTRLGEEAGVPSVPNVLGRATSYSALLDAGGERRARRGPRRADPVWRLGQDDVLRPWRT